MILGIGVDTIETERFALWHTYSQKKLSRIFSPQEIEYCLQQPNKSAERFAARFAAREALFKALSYAQQNHLLSFLTLCSRISIAKVDSRPYIVINGDIGIDLSGIVFHLSLSHSCTHATAFIVIERQIL